MACTKESFSKISGQWTLVRGFWLSSLSVYVVVEVGCQ